MNNPHFALKPIAAALLAALAMPVQAQVVYITDPAIGAFANGISADGNVVVGRGVNDSKGEAFRWEGGVLTWLGFLGTSTNGSATMGPRHA